MTTEQQLKEIQDKFYPLIMTRRPPKEVCAAILDWHKSQAVEPLTEEQAEQMAKEFANNNCDGSTSWTSMCIAYKSGLLARNPVQPTEEFCQCSFVMIMRGEDDKAYCGEFKRRVEQTKNVTNQLTEAQIEKAAEKHVKSEQAKYQDGKLPDWSPSWFMANSYRIALQDMKAGKFHNLNEKEQ